LAQTGNSTDNDSLDSGGGSPGHWSGDKWRTPFKLKVLICTPKEGPKAVQGGFQSSSAGDK